MSDHGAAGLVARWGFEAPNGPSSVNPKSGAFGIAQWLGPRKPGVAGDASFDGQLAYAAKELNGPESRAAGFLRNANDPASAAQGASAFERAENYNASTNTDTLTARTEAAIPGVMSAGVKAAPAVGGIPDTASRVAEGGRFQGTMNVGGTVFPFATGGHARGASGAGDYEVHGFDPNALGGRGAFRTADQGGRSAIEIHDSFGQEDVNKIVTSGCFAVPTSQYPELKRILSSELEKNGGRMTLRIGSDGNGEIVPIGTPPHVSVASSGGQSVAPINPSNPVVASSLNRSQDQVAQATPQPTARDYDTAPQTPADWTGTRDQYIQSLKPRADNAPVGPPSTVAPSGGGLPERGPTALPAGDQQWLDHYQDQQQDEIANGSPRASTLSRGINRCVGGSHLSPNDSRG